MDLPEHDHCQYCGDPVPFDQAYCSMECYNAHQEEKKKAKRKDMAIAFLAAAGVIVILVVGYIFRAARRSRPVSVSGTSLFVRNTQFVSGFRCDAKPARPQLLKGGLRCEQLEIQCKEVLMSG